MNSYNFNSFAAQIDRKGYALMITFQNYHVIVPAEPVSQKLRLVISLKSSIETLLSNNWQSIHIQFENCSSNRVHLYLYRMMHSSTETAFIIIAFIRLSQLFIDYNYDHPDEYWQGSEVAHKIYYGFGYLSWEWTMEEPIRSPLYQLYLSIGYFLCEHTHCTPYFRQIAPKIMQMILSLLCDYFLLRTAAHYVKNISTTVCLCMLTNWYYFSMLNRIYSNSVETCLAVISFYFWATREERKINDYISRFLVVINFSLRPTSLFLWALIWPYELLTKKTGRIGFILINAIQLIVTGLFSAAVGSLWYGRVISVDFNFFKYNVFLKFSEFYGVNSFFEYFYLFVPFIMTSYLIPFFLSLKENLPYLKNWWQDTKLKADEAEGKVEVLEVWQGKRYWELFILTITILLLLSLSTHKEPRFLLIITPFLLLLSIAGFQKLQKYRGILVIVLLVNVAVFAVMTLGMKTGGTQILRDLRKEVDKYPLETHPNLTVMYLCEPHALPLMTVLQRNVDFRLIDTSPFRKMENFDEYRQLRDNPQQLYSDMAQGKDPDYIIIQQMYSTKGPMINQRYGFLLQKGYHIISARRNRNLIEEMFAGWDGFALLGK